MPDLDRNAGAATDPDRLVERGHDSVPLAAQVGGIDATELRGLPCQSDQLLRFRIRRRRIFQRARKPDRARAHPLLHQSLHLIRLLRSRLPILVTEHHAADARCADVGREVDADSLLFDPRKILSQRAPVGRHPVVLVNLPVRLDDEVVERRDRIPLPRYLRGDALKDLGGDPRLDQDAELRLPEHVDEAGSDYFAVRIDRFRARGLFEVADRRNSSVSDAEIARIPRGARSIDDPSVHDHEIEALVSGLRDRRDRGPKECQPGGGASRPERPRGPSRTVAA